MRISNDSKSTAAREGKRANTHSSPDTRTLIIETAIAHFARDGFAAVSMRELADKVGVTKPALYYYFDSKEALFEAALRQILSEQPDDLVRDIDSLAPLPAKLERLMCKSFEHAVSAAHRIQFFVRFVLFAFPHDTPESVATIAPTFHEIAGEGTRGLYHWFRAAQEQGEIPATEDLHELMFSFLGQMNIRIFLATRESRYKLTPELAQSVCTHFLRSCCYRSKNT